MPSFYVDSTACFREGTDMSEWLMVNVGLRQSCVLSPWLFNEYIDGVLRNVNASFDRKQLLFADNTAPVANQRRSCVD